jgi:F-type H+-transporting ATPase subunit epsilon
MSDSSPPLTLSIVSPEETLLETTVSKVQFPGTNGLMGVLPRHAQLVSTTDSGMLRAVANTGENIEILIHDGFADVTGNSVVVLTRSAEKVDDIDLERARSSADRAKKRLESKKDSTIDVARANASLRRALMREKYAKNS